MHASHTHTHSSRRYGSQSTPPGAREDPTVRMSLDIEGLEQSQLHITFNDPAPPPSTMPRKYLSKLASQNTCIKAARTFSLKCHSFATTISQNLNCRFKNYKASPPPRTTSLKIHVFHEPHKKAVARSIMLFFNFHLHRQYSNL